MPEQVYIGNFPKGLNLYALPFNIDNDAFPFLFNFYIWRGRAKRKRGTFLLGQLQRQLQSVASPNNWQIGSIGVLDGSGNLTVNLVTHFSLGATATIASGTLTLSDGTNTYTEPATPDGTLIGAPGGSGTINYATGDLTITGGAAGGTLVGFFSYFPGLPVMGLRDFVPFIVNQAAQYPLLLAFDQKYAYQIDQTTSIVHFYNVTFYKGTNNPFVWHGDDYQQFWTTNYSRALWATNNVPGFHFVNGTYSAGSTTADITFNFKSGGTNFTTLVIGDKLWFNEWTTGGSNLNGLVGTVSNVAGAAAGNYIVHFDSAVVVAGSGIAQLLTNSISGQDGIKWYDGDPTSHNGIPDATGLGWVNFAPPLTASSVSIENLTSALYYLVGATAILSFKDRLLFFAPWIQTSSGPPILLQDVVIWSWNGTPYYASLTPTGETSDPAAYYVDQTGRGGYLSAGISQPIITVTNNEDVLLIGFGGNGRQTRFVYTGNDISPFLFFYINSELNSTATFSGITLDRGGVSIGSKGIVLTTQQSAERIDLEIPDLVFQIEALNHGVNRVNSVRDFYKEWIYWCYPINDSQWKFPTQTFLWNYRDNTWAILYENFTAQGTYHKQMQYTWATLPFSTWNEWREPWSAGSTSAQFPSIIGGNPQGYVLIKGQGTGEAQSGTILAISNNGGNTQITSINHCVTDANPNTGFGDFLYFQGALGISPFNGLIGLVISVQDADNFTVDIPFPTGTYLGLGTFARLAHPLIQTKQFPFYWKEGRQTRLSVQKYLMDRTAAGQVTVNIYLSQDPDDVWNSTVTNPPNSSLVYSQIMFTCPESTNIGLTPANINLQTPTASTQFQIWHRMNTSLIGDTFQIGITLSEIQMKDLTLATSEIALQGMQLTIDRGPLLS